MTVKRLGAALMKHGLKPGDILSICAPNSIEHVFLFFSVSMIGAVYHVSGVSESQGMYIIFIFTYPMFYYDLLFILSCYTCNLANCISLVLVGQEGVSTTTRNIHFFK